MKCRWIAELLLAGAMCMSAGGQGLITTFAGSDWVFPGNGKPALSAPLGRVTGVTVDSAGNPVLADTDNCIAARVNKDGTLSVLAGNGVCINQVESGDGGSATSAAILPPSAVFYDTPGNLYVPTIGLASLSTIRKISSAGIISTLGASGFKSMGNFAMDASGAIYVPDFYNHCVEKIPAKGAVTVFAGQCGTEGYTGDGGPATLAFLGYPIGVAIDKTGNVFIADRYDGAIRKVTVKGVITHIATIPLCAGLAFDSAGALYIGSDSAIYKLPAGAANPVPIAGKPGTQGFSGDNGPAVNALLSGPIYMAPDNFGNLFVADQQNYRLRKISDGGVITTVAGNGTYRYTGEHAPAQTSPLNGPRGLAFDTAGNPYIAEESGNRVRKVVAGSLTTVAGTGLSNFVGDNGPATMVSIGQTKGIAFDKAGNLYVADWDGGRVVKVSPTGAASVFFKGQGKGDVAGIAFDSAGNMFVSNFESSYGAYVYKIDPNGTQVARYGSGPYGNSGNNVPASTAELNFPYGLAVDSQDNLYIAETNGHRVRKVTPDGIISTFAGNGTFGYGGDGGLAIDANLGQPQGLAFDRLGNLYIADDGYLGYGVVRRVTPAGIISTYAGGGSADELGDGKPAFRSTLGDIFGLVFDAAGNLYISDATSNRVRVVLAKTPAIQVSQTDLTFTAPSGGARVNQQLTVSGDISGLEFTVTVKTQSGGNWLSTSADSGSTPELLTITADPTNLTPGVYTGCITISQTAAMPTSFTVNVSFTVENALMPKLGTDQPNISFAFPKGAAAGSSTLRVLNAGGGKLDFTGSVTVKTGSSWLSISPSAGTASPGNPVVLTLTADPKNVNPGTYTASLSIVSNGGTATIPVTMAVSSLTQGLLLTQTGISFTAVENGGIVPPQSFGVVNTGMGSLAWTATTSTLAGGDKWLTVQPSTGTSTAGAAAPQVSVSVNASGLTAGNYYGLVSIAAPGAANTPQVVTIFLNVLATGLDPGASVQPREIFISATPGGGSPGSQNLLVYNIGATPKTFFTAHSEAFPLYALPQAATLNPDEPTTVVLQPSADFPAGTYTDTLNFQFSDGRIETVKVIVTSNAANNAGLSSANVKENRDLRTHRFRTKDEPPGACVPTMLIPAITTLGELFAVSAGWPVALSADVRNNCGNPLVSGSVTASFDNGDPPLRMASLNDGTWQATWPTRTGSLQNVKITVAAADDKLQISGTREIDGAISSPQTPPTFIQAQILSSASPVSSTALAPGSMVTIYGDRLAENAVTAQSFPLATTLPGSSTTVFMGDKAAPLLYVAQGQINALVPFGLNPNTDHQVRIQRGNTYSQPVSIIFAPAQPGVFGYNGAAIAFAYRGTERGFLVAASSPAKAGDTLVVYCAGLGLTDPLPNDGYPTQGARTVDSVTASIGGQNATVVYSGLVAGLAGLYQVNMTVPLGITPGDAVPLTLTISGQTSPIANVAVVAEQ